MAKTTIIRIRGIGEKLNGRTILHDVTDMLDPHDFEFVDLGWAAQYGIVGAAGILGEDYETALTEGLALLREQLDKGPAILLGYSGGAHLAHLAAFYGHENLVAVGFIADPAQPVGISKHGHGITGEILPLANGVPARWIYNPGDIICCAPADSPLRTISDATSKFGVYNFASWSLDIVTRLRSMRWQVLGKYLFNHPAAHWSRIDTAIDGAMGYLSGRQHVGAYKGWPQFELARWVELVELQRQHGTMS